MMSATDDLRDPGTTLTGHNGESPGGVVEIIKDVQRKIGQDLHDGVEQELVGLGMISQALLSRLQVDGEEITAESLRGYQELARRLVEGFSRAHEELKAISRGLVPANGVHENLSQALESLAARTNELQGIACSFQGNGDSRVLSLNQALQLYRIAQEGVCNALKHSGASQILIALDCSSERAMLHITDNGKGIGQASSNGGLGLESMQSRSKSIGAKLEITSVPSGGTTVGCALEVGSHE